MDLLVRIGSRRQRLETVRVVLSSLCVVRRWRAAPTPSPPSPSLPYRLGSHTASRPFLLPQLHTPLLRVGVLTIIDRPNHPISRASPPPPPRAACLRAPRSGPGCKNSPVSCLRRRRAASFFARTRLDLFHSVAVFFNCSDRRHRRQ